MTLNQMYIGIAVTGVVCSVIIRIEISRVLQYTVARGERRRRDHISNLLEKFTLSLYYDAAPMIFFLWYYAQMIMTVAWFVLFFVLSHNGCSQSTFDKLYKGFVIGAFSLLFIYRTLFVGFGHTGFAPPRWDYSKYKVRRKK